MTRATHHVSEKAGTHVVCRGCVDRRSQLHREITKQERRRQRDVPTSLDEIDALKARIAQCPCRAAA